MKEKNRAQRRKEEKERLEKLKAKSGQAKYLTINQKFIGFLNRNQKVLSILTQEERTRFERRVRKLKKQCRMAVKAGDKTKKEQVKSLGLFERAWC